MDSLQLTLEESNPLLTLDPGVAIWSIVVFGVLLGILTRFVWRPLMAGIDAREIKLRNAVEQAEQARLSNERNQQMRQKVMEDAKQQASDIVAQARITGEALARNIEQEAQKERMAILAAAEERVESLYSAAQQELKKETIQTTIQLTQQLLLKEIDIKNSELIVDEMLQNLEREQR